MASTSKTISDEDTWVPEGYVVIIGPNKQRYVVPEFCAPTLQQQIDVEEKKKDKEVHKAAGAVSQYIDL